ncbi:MAG: tetratricopeptide repeat protein [Gemmatimonadaceae bacterium]|nr:tetratricopeptide repeat protein [Gemmatimonadaceae bacterium]
MMIAGGGARLDAQSPAPVRAVAQQASTTDSLRAVVRSTASSMIRAKAALQLAESMRGTVSDRDLLAAFEKAVALAHAAPDSATLANALHSLGLFYWSRNQYDSGLVHLDRAREIRQLTGDRFGLGQELNSIGASYYQIGIYEQALEAYLQALDIRREVADTAGMARTLTNIGMTYHDWGHHDRARRIFEEAAVLATAADSGAILGYLRNSQAMLFLDLRNYAQAREYLTQSLAAYSSRRRVTPADSVSGWSLNTATAGLLLIREGRPAEAVVVLDSLLAAGVRRGSVRGQARANLYLGEAHLALGDLSQARAAFTRSLGFARPASQRMIALEALQHLAEIEESSGNTGAALRYLRGHMMLRDSLFSQTTAQRIATMDQRMESEREEREMARLRENERIQTAVIARQRAIVTLVSLVLLLTAALLGFAAYYHRVERARSAEMTKTNANLEAVNLQLRTALADVRTLTGLIPICASCKKVRDDQGYWNSVESYISSHSDATFSHGICHTCAVKLYGDELAGEMLESTESPSPPPR